MDMVVQTHHIPVPGETVLSGSFFMNPGGSMQSFALDKTDLNNETDSKSKKTSVEYRIDRISGRVIDDKGNPLFNVSITIKGTNVGNDY